MTADNFKNEYNASLTFHKGIVMKTKQLLLFLFILFVSGKCYSQSGTFDFTGATQNGETITQTVSGVTVNIFSDHSTVPPSMTIQDWSLYPPFDANVATMNDVAKPSCTFSFDNPVNIKSLLVVDFKGVTNYDLLFTPNIGTAYHQVINGVSGSVVSLNFSSLTSFVITNNAGGNIDLGFDNVIMSSVNNVTGVTVGTISINQIPLSWTNPSGSTGIIVLCKAGSAVLTTVPTVGYSSIPSGNNDFTSALDAGTSGIGSAGDKLVYKGTGTSVTTTNLVNGTTYHFKVFNWDGSFWSSGGATSGDQALPVELVSFSAQLSNNTIQLKWSTATEAYNYGFDVERRELNSDQVSAVRWKKIGFVPGNGTSNISHSYRFTEENPVSGRSAYRLKQIDNGGAFRYSQSAEIEIAAPKTISLAQNFPNPFNPTTLIRYQLSEFGYVRLTVFDLFGRELAVLVNEEKPAGLYSVTFDGSRYASGIYFYKMQTPAESDVRRMILTK